MTEAGYLRQEEDKDRSTVIYLEEPMKNINGNLETCGCLLRSGHMYGYLVNTFLWAKSSNFNRNLGLWELQISQISH